MGKCMDRFCCECSHEKTGVIEELRAENKELREEIKNLQEDVKIFDELRYENSDRAAAAEEEAEELREIAAVAVEALKKIGAHGGVCTDDENCPLCIAEEALNQIEKSQ